jgi:phospholipase C
LSEISVIEGIPPLLIGLTVSANQTSFIDDFRADAMSGNLASVVYIVPQDQLTEHPPDTPRDGGWQQREIIEALVNSPSYKNTALFITYDGKQGTMSIYVRA